jgi:hypothetical protein
MKKWILWTLVTVGVIVFYLTYYGSVTLLPTNINWLMSARHDWGTHYLGWAFYKNEPWHFPLGKVTNYYYPLSTNVGFTDSIPLLAIFFKVFAPLLPADFQYFGIWLFLCHLLTAWSALLVLKLFKVNDFIAGVAALLIAINPVLVYRGMHPALCAHWLILGCIYVYFLSPRNIRTNRILLYQFILLALSAMINPYLCWMVLGFTLATPVKLCFFDKMLTKRNFIIYLGVSIFSVLLLWYLTGLIDFKTKEDLGIGGAYGLYAMNLNALFNPFGYSTFLPRLPWVSHHQYEGYMYLGFGMILLVFVLLIGSLYTRFKYRKERQTITSGKAKKDRSHLPLLILAFIYAIIAITLVFTFNEKVLFKIPAPALFIKMEEVFRACGRFFWVPYYLILLFTIIGVAKWKVRPMIPSIIIALVFIIQLYDLKNMLRNRGFAGGTYTPPMESAAWLKLMGQFDEVICLHPFFEPGNWSMSYQDFSFLALKAGKPIDLAYVARANSQGEAHYTDSLRTTAGFGHLSPKALYIINANYIDAWSIPLKTGAANLHMLDGCYFYFAKEAEKETLDTLTRRLDAMNRKKLDSVFDADGRKIQFREIPKALAAGKHSIKNNMEKIEYGDDFFAIQGWAVRDSTPDNTGDSVFLTLSSQQGNWWAPSGISEREDVSNVFLPSKIHNPAVHFLGFTDSVPRGEYDLGVIVKTSQGQYIQAGTGRIVKVKITEYETPVKTTTLPPVSRILYDANVEEKPTSFIVGGWAALENRDADGCTISLILKSSENTYVLKTEPVLRADVTTYFKNKYRLDNSGYSTRIAKSSLPRGTYQIGFLIRDAGQNKEYSMLIDKLITIP